ncbi:hypothetical protein [Gandjariella thermophila]|uniref:Uncharacterized protein n=1 Tax=Gandjariella thermophila TaxID=1931992 RepID=A0A4D4J5G7_9PSEU|nr:hypothetical protein [Gandjariella thermophila]GDY29227.1 hypothetical protein GTS_08600 [Gandjariella thermophila]
MTSSRAELAVVLWQTQWALDAVAHQLPTGQTTAEGCMELATIQEQVAALPRAMALRG